MITLLRVERMKVNCILVVVSGVYYGAVSTAASLRLSLNAAFNFTRATGLSGLSFATGCVRQIGKMA